MDSISLVKLRFFSLMLQEYWETDLCFLRSSYFYFLNFLEKEQQKGQFFVLSTVAFPVAIKTLTSYVLRTHWHINKIKIST